MSDGPYLILHKVRGEPAFDIAERCQIGDEEGWVVSTSGHRAYPLRAWPLGDLVDSSDINLYGAHERPATMTFTMPADWPDHIEIRPAPPAPKATGNRAIAFLQSIGRLRSSQETDRRA